jgi:hypothetical protein
MKLIILASMALTFSFNVMSQVTPSQSSEQFCADRSESSFVKSLTQYPQNLLTFQNHGGLGNGGVCWWHSRFQRNALYLTIYKPGEDYPSKEEAVKIISKIRSGKEVVTIRGFKNFSEFSSAYSAQIQKELESWQKSDGIVKFNWVMGLKGNNTVSSEKLEAMMSELYEYVTVKGNIAYEKLQIKGIVAHSWLVINMKKVTDGYDLEVIDSNSQYQTTIYKYRYGQTSFSHWAYGEFVPYLERANELDKVNDAILKVCNPEQYKEKMKKEREAQEEENSEM